MKKITLINLLRSKATLIMCCSLIVFSSCKKENISSNNSLPTNISGETNRTSSEMQNALVAWYTFNGDVLDHSGHANNVIFNNATPTTGKNGKPNNAYYFNGSNYMEVANSTSLNPASQITLYTVVKVGGFYQGTCHGNQILIKGNDVKTNGVYSMAFDDGRYYNYNQCFQPVQPTKQNFFARYGDEDGSGTSTGAMLFII